MHDVAALAGVALATVSRVVNGKPGVSPAMQARVETAIARLDYRRNVNASSLRRLDRKTATIGLVLEDVANPFMSALHRAVEDCARERGVLVFAGSCDEDSTREQELISALRTRRVDGIIVVPAGTDHSYLLPASPAGDGDGLRRSSPGIPRRRQRDLGRPRRRSSRGRTPAWRSVIGGSHTSAPR